MNIDWLLFAFMCGVGFIGVIIGIVVEKIHQNKRIPWAGNVVIDTRRPNGDTIGIESPHNVTHWHKYKQIKFTVIPLWENMGDKRGKKKV